MKSVSSVQPSIPRANSPAPIAWSALDPAQRSAIMAATEKRSDRFFKARLRHSIMFGTWDQLGKATRELLYATDWKAALR